VDAAKKTDLNLPNIIRLEGTNVEEARKILQESGLNFDFATTFDDAAQKIAKHAAS
jgi:succinyl-CoA synthetase beta subunit